ncbi:MAG: LamG domain-containing protein [Phycisphaerales bacterium]|nr:LamG domain-containing protein [Phycisphaerales bacterium]
MSLKSISSRNGSIYLITLITIAAIVSMVLLGVRLRSSTNEQSALIEQMSEANTGVLDAAELAIETIVSDQQWRNTANSGVVYSELSVGTSSYSAVVVDATTSIKPTASTTSYRVTVASGHETVRSVARVDIFATQYDYLTYLRTLPLKHYWPLNEYSNPTTAVDLKGNYDGTYQSPAAGGASYNDEGGPVPVFTSIGDQVHVPWGKDFDLSDGSISLWMRCTGGNKFENYSFLGMQYDLGGLPTLNMSVYLYGVTAYVDDDNRWSLGNFTMTSQNLITPGTWYHIVLTWGTNGMVLYVDGVEKASNSSNRDGLKTAKAGQGGEQPLHLGDGYDTGDLRTPEDAFDGSIAHVALFNSQLRASEVAALAAIKPDLRTYTIVPDSWQRLYNQ